MKKHFFLSIVFCLLLSLQSASQTTTAPKEPSTQADETNSDLVITANVRAKELKVEVVPNPTVSFTGNQPRQTVWEASRENLPPAVEAGAVYRDIGIRLRIYSRFAEIQRIVIEALEETGQPQTTNNSQPNNQTDNQVNQPAKSPIKP